MITNSTRCARVAPLSGFDPAAASYEFIVPNQINNMHDGTIADGDNFLRAFVPTITGSSSFANSLLLITWDEDSDCSGCTNRVPTLAISPLGYTGLRSSTAHDHYSLLHTVQAAWGLPCLNNTCTANDLREFFGGSAAPAPPTAAPTLNPTSAPTATPTLSPTSTPSQTTAPTLAPTPNPTPRPTSTPAPTPTPAPVVGWVNVVNDQFNSGGVPSHWSLYDGPYGSGPQNCATPGHVSVSGGYMHLLMAHESSGNCGAGWYTGGMMVSQAFDGIDQRVTVRFRVVRSGVASHFIIPMRWPDIDSSWPAGGEEDFCETDDLSGCSTYLHYGSSNSQVSHDYSVGLSSWHTVRFQRLNHVMTAYIDNMSTPAWTYTGSKTTLPDTLKRTVLQQECQSSCPSGTSGSEDIQIDWITIDDAA